MELIRGTLDLLVLKALSWGPMHGYAVTRWIRSRTDGTLEVEDGALYQALYRMEGRDWIESEWGKSENNRRAKFYALTPRGRRELASGTRDMRRYVDAMFDVLEAETA